MTPEELLNTPPTLDQLREDFAKKQEGRSRYHKSICPVCGSLCTNQAMGRKAHMAMHKRAHAKEKTGK